MCIKLYILLIRLIYALTISLIASAKMYCHYWFFIVCYRVAVFWILIVSIIIISSGLMSNDVFFLQTAT